MTATHEELLQAIGKLQGKVEGLGDSMSAMDGRLQAVEKVANMGQGALWMFLKVGGFLAILTAALAWLWEQVHP